MTGFLGEEISTNFVKVQNFDKVEFENRSTFLPEFFGSCCRILAKTGAFWQQPGKETRTSLQQMPF